MPRDGTPVTFPIAPFYNSENGVFYSLGSIGYPGKHLRMRNDPRSSLLFSDPTESGLVDPPAILVQGDAKSPDRIGVPGDPDLDYMLLTVFRRQPVGIIKALSNPMTRFLMDWYMMRLPFSIGTNPLLTRGRVRRRQPS